jgi:hypothetical protein
MAMESLQLTGLKWGKTAGTVNNKLAQLRHEDQLDERDFLSYYILEEQMEFIAQRQCNLKPELIVTIDVTLDFKAQQIRFAFHDKKGKIHHGLTCVEKRISVTTYNKHFSGAGNATRASINHARNNS